ncbi:hypothetical protein ZIOFF_076074 [Zingiber officinale]|uniref:C2H2-type domain-containing protein n=1 Tax=Zingiber officinale TaxID=94328 RepID=A0A8J5ER20_ZINOF|nr:hypothetical protein ZIOFF_076074 [Zingiber officinale]
MNANRGKNILGLSMTGVKDAGDGVYPKSSVFELDLLSKLGAIKAEPASPEPAPRVFSCNYCPKTYSNPQALGGHQNAHRRERNLAMRGAAAEFLQYAGRRLDVIHKPYLGAPAASASAAAGGPLYRRHNGYLQFDAAAWREVPALPAPAVKLEVESIGRQWIGGEGGGSYSNAKPGDSVGRRLHEAASGEVAEAPVGARASLRWASLHGAHVQLHGYRSDGVRHLRVLEFLATTLQHLRGGEDECQPRKEHLGFEHDRGQGRRRWGVPEVVGPRARPFKQARSDQGRARFARTRAESVLVQLLPEDVLHPQALGGHQNAHRRERNLAMRGAAAEFLQYAGRRRDVPVRSVIHMPYHGAPAASAAAGGLLYRRRSYPAAWREVPALPAPAVKLEVESIGRQWIGGEGGGSYSNATPGDSSNFIDLTLRL